jgi:hypothetical protein
MDSRKKKRAPRFQLHRKAGCLMLLFLICPRLSETIMLLGVLSCQHYAQIPSLRISILLSLWVINFDLSGKGDPTNSYATVSIALRVI